MNQEHNTGTGRVRFGTLDWRHPAWEASYYPDDLPTDWQFGYYANELGAVLLEPAGWLAGAAADLADLAVDAHDDFRFYLLLDPAQDLAMQRARAAALGDVLGGLLWPDADAPEGVLAARVAGPADALPGCVRVWGDEAGIRVALLDVTGLDLRASRGVLERLAPQLAKSGDTALIVTGQDVQPGAVRELQTVAELMGVA